MSLAGCRPEVRGIQRVTPPFAILLLRSVGNSRSFGGRSGACPDHARELRHNAPPPMPVISNEATRCLFPCLVPARQSGCAERNLSSPPRAFCAFFVSRRFVRGRPGWSCGTNRSACAERNPSSAFFTTPPLIPIRPHTESCATQAESKRRHLKVENVTGRERWQRVAFDSRVEPVHRASSRLRRDTFPPRGGI
jgi:hypothetical protein